MTEADGRAQARNLFDRHTRRAYLRAELNRSLDVAERDRIGFNPYRLGYLSELVLLIAEADLP